MPQYAPCLGLLKLHLLANVLHGGHNVESDFLNSNRNKTEFMSLWVRFSAIQWDIMSFGKLLFCIEYLKVCRRLCDRPVYSCPVTFHLKSIWLKYNKVENEQ